MYQALSPNCWNHRADRNRLNPPHVGSVPRHLCADPLASHLTICDRAMINLVFWNLSRSSKSRMRTALWHFREARITFSAASFCVASTSINLIWILRDFCQQLHFAFLIQQFFQNFNRFKANKLTFKGSKVKHGFAFWNDESSLEDNCLILAISLLF